MRKSTMIASLVVCSLLLISNRDSEFGSIQLGSKVAKGKYLPGKRIGQCAPSDCEVLGKDGVRYTVFGGILTRKRVFRSEAGYKMPFGLYAAHSEKDAIEIIQKRFRVRLRSPIKGTFAAIADLNNGEKAEVYVIVDRGGAVREFGVTLGETG